METCVTILFGLNKVIARVERHVNVHDFSDRFFFFSLSAFKISMKSKTIERVSMLKINGRLIEILSEVYLKRRFIKDHSEKLRYFTPHDR